MNKLRNNLIKKTVYFPILSGFLFLFIFYIGYLDVPDNLYKYRDDGIITLSHAKNLADFGSIGINPSGERIEGYSPPVQFGIYFILYKFFNLSYKTYMDMQTYVCTFLLGFFFIKFFKENYLFGLFFSFIAAVFLIRSPSFFLWHGSGMENAITNVLCLVSLYLLFKMFEEKRINYYYTLIIFLTSISRIESIYYILPILIIYSISWIYVHKSFNVITFMFTVLFLWLSFNILRYSYFGEIFPNTAFAQNISLLERINDLISFSGQIYKESFFYSSLIFKMHWGIFLFITPIILFFIKNKIKYNILYLMAYPFALLVFLNPFFFGKSRIDPTRTTSHSVVVILLLLFITLFQLKKKIMFGFTFIIVILSIVYLNTTTIKFRYNRSPKRLIGKYYIGFSTEPFYTIRNELLELAQNNDLFRPTVGIIDIGAISWHKDFNILDFGFLGNHVLAKEFENKQLVKNYILDYQAPDFIHFHGIYSLHYGFLFKDKRFRKYYEPIYESEFHNRKNPRIRSMNGLWIRKDIKKNSMSHERILIDRLKTNLSVSVVRKEIDYCKNNDKSPLFIIRTLYRFLPEFRKKGNRVNDIIKLFRHSSTYNYAKALLNCKDNKNWHKELISYLKNNRVLKSQTTL